jgi:predicted aspartyl protease
MITGVVESDEGRIRLTVQGPHGQQQEIDAVIDTAYTASLSLRPETITRPGLTWRSVDGGVLADGSECDWDVYEAEVVWDGDLREIHVDEINSGPLIGMRLLNGFELRMQVRTSGTVQIERLAD